MVQKCEFCKNKKVSTMFAFGCKCGLKLLCEKCRYPDEHKCTFDFRKEGKEQLEKTNPKVVEDKLDKI